VFFALGFALPLPLTDLVRRLWDKIGRAHV